MNVKIVNNSGHFVGWWLERNAFLLLQRDGKYKSGWNYFNKECSPLQIPNKKVELHHPLYVYWHITYECNFQCSHCFAGKNIVRDDALEHARSTVLDKIIRSDVLKVDFSGGEPLLFKDLFKYISTVKKFGLGTTLTSNGWLVQDFIEEIEQFVDWTILSIDGSNETTHDRLRSKSGAFKRVTAAARQLSRRKKFVRINTVVSRQNYHEVHDIALLARDIGASQITFMNFIPLGTGLLHRGAYEISIPKFRAVVDPVKMKLEHDNFKINISDSFRYVGFPAIEPDGLVTTIDKNGNRVSLGSLVTTSLVDVWSEVSHKVEFSRLG